jgi:hypothetical protein
MKSEALEYAITVIEAYAKRDSQPKASSGGSI